MPPIPKTRECNQPSIAYTGQRGGVANHLYAPGEKIDEGLAGTTIRHVFKLNAGGFGKNLALQLCNGAIAGGTEAQFARVEPILKAISPNVVHAGGVGNGHVMKLANNMLSAETLSGVLFSNGLLPNDDIVRRLKEAGIAMERGWVLVDERLRTNVAGVYAVGDITPGLQLAHRGFQQGIFVAEELGGLAPRPIPDVDIPKVTYCEPEVASVGLTEVQAREQFGDNVAVYEYNLGGNGKSQILATTGFIKLVQQKDGPVVGIHMVGSRIGEQIGEAQLIVNWEAHPEDVATLIHAHPTQNEAMGEAHLALAGKPLHAHA